MFNQGFWEAGLEGTADRLNASLLQSDVIGSRPAAGQTGRFFFATDTKELSRDNGTGWDAIIPPGPIFKTGDESVTSSTTMQDDDDLKFTVSANEKWHIRLILRMSAANVTPDIKITWTVPSGAVGRWWQVSDLVASTALPFTAIGLVSNISSNLDTTERTQVYEGYVVIGGTAGTVQLQWAQTVSDAGAVTVHEESHLIVTRGG